MKNNLSKLAAAVALLAGTFGGSTASAQIDIELVALSLRSTNQIELNYDVGDFGTLNGTPSDAGSFFVELVGDPDLVPDPAPSFSDFIVTPTDPWATIDPFFGRNPIVFEPVLQNDPTLVDTIVGIQRPNLAPSIGETADVPIEMISLSLRSLDPITVQYGNQGTALYDVYVQLSDDPQPQGQARFRVDQVFPTPSGPIIGGTFDLGQDDNNPDIDGLGLPMIYDLEFQKVPDSTDAPPAISDPNRQFHFFALGNNGVGGRFEMEPIPEPTALVVGLVGLAGLGLGRRRGR